MHLLPFFLRLSLVGSSCALVLSGLALAYAGFAGEQGLIAASSGVVLLVAAGAPLLSGRHIVRLLREQQKAAPDIAAPVSAAPVEAPPAEAGKSERPPGPDDAPSSADEEALRRAQKAQAVDRLRDGIAHDLNNRLMVISANIDAVARQVKDQPALQRKLLSALVATDQAAKLIAKSTAFSRRGETQVQYVDLAERIGSVATLMSRSLLRDTVELRLSLEEGLWPVEADPDDIETAVVTISAHVRDALTQGGTIRLDARNMRFRKGSLPNSELEGDFVKLVIRSSGMKVPPREAGETGGRAVTWPEMDLPSWLNLTRSLHFLRPLGGAFEVRHDGDEAAIALYLPRARAATLIPSCPSEDGDGASDSMQGQAEIFVVDDELEVAMALQDMLEELGYATRIATNARQAMKSLSARKPGLVLTDVAMPGTMNGAMLAREVRQIFPDLPVLLITGSPVVVEGQCEFPVLQKPIFSRDLHAAIQRHLTPQDTDKIVPLFPRPAQRIS